MTRQPWEHLSDAEVERCSEALPGRAGGADAGLAQHLEGCASCRQRVQAVQTANAALLELRRAAVAERGPACPEDADWLQAAAGIMPQDDIQKRLEHAAQCEHCGPLLGEMAEDFADELSPEEQTLLAAARSSKSEWQRQLAARLSAESHPARPAAEPPRWWTLAWPALNYAAAAVALVIAATLAFWPTPRPATEEAEQLLAEAYTEQRTLELRIPGAGHAPVRVERGPERSRLSRPPALLEAEALIARQLRNSPNDASWWHMRGRAELLDWKYEAAIKSLKRALDSQPDSAPIKVDLATAYFQRAEAEDRAIDYGMTIELLGQVLARHPDDAVALYNRAIAEERMFLYNQALTDWEHYLRVEPQGAWAREAQERLTQLRKQIREQRERSAMPPTAPALFLERLTANERPRVDAENHIGSHSENYLRIATSDWLQTSFPTIEQAENSQVQARANRALSALAAVLVRRHSDHWLEDMLRHPPSREYALAISTLTKSIRATTVGNATEAEHEAKRAQRLFRAAGSRAGIIRAQLELAYALQRASRSTECLQVSEAARRELRDLSYTWINAQLNLEFYACLAMMGRFDAAEAYLAKALQSAETSGYTTTYSRALGFVATLQTEKGNSSVAWNQDRRGLALHWSGSSPPSRAYQFYSDLISAAEDSGNWHLQLAVAREAAVSADSTPHRDFAAFAHYRLGTIARMTGDHDEAIREMLRAQDLFGSLPDSPAIRLYRQSCEIALASLEMQRKENASALSRLERLKPDFQEVANFTVLLPYYETLGSLHLARKDPALAEPAFRSAIAVAEEGGANLSNERDRIRWEQETGKAYRGLVRLYLEHRRDSKTALAIWQSFRGTAVDYAGIGPIRAARAATSKDPHRKASEAVFRRPEKETVISYAQFPDGLAIWVFDGRGVHATWSPVAAEKLETVVNRFSRRCADPSSDLVALQQDGRDLYGWLIAPIVEHLDAARTLIVEPDGVIGRIPMEALPDSSGRYLGQRFALVWSPGVRYRSLRRPASGWWGRERALVVGVSTLGGTMTSSYPPLPDAALEAQLVAAHFPKGKLLLGREASLANVEASLSQADIFHFAGHALVEKGRARLVFTDRASLDDEDSRSGPDVLDASDLRPKQLERLKLAFFSACSTGGADADGLVDPDSLVRVFLRAGVPYVVASRWSVDSTSTRTFVSAFYNRLATGTSVPQAARDAMGGKLGLSHPYYWAAFVVFGS